jgi:hypothetical protein
LKAVVVAFINIWGKKPHSLTSLICPAKAMEICQSLRYFQQVIEA